MNTASQKKESPEATTPGSQDTTGKSTEESFSQAKRRVNEYAKEPTGSDTRSATRIVAALWTLFPRGAVVEVRIPDSRYGTVSGYFDDFPTLANTVARFDGYANIYFTLNTIDPRLIARANNRLRDRAKTTTSDSDVLQRVWLPLDFDPIRPAGVSSTDAEHDATLIRAQTCLRWLHARGITHTILADSGNGAHVLTAIDLPNEKTHTDLVKRCIEAVACRFADEIVGVDLTVFNAARIWKLYGTCATKGDVTPGQPHRRARLLEVADDLSPTPRHLLEQLAACAPVEQKHHARMRGHGTFDLAAWIAEHHLAVHGPLSWNGNGEKWIFDICPWNSAHANKSAYLIRFASGALAAGCHHNGCAGKNWHDLRDTIEPEWREWGNTRGPEFDRGEARTDTHEEQEAGEGNGPDKEEQVRSRQKSQSGGLSLTHLRDLLKEPEEHVAWLVDKMLPAGGFSLVVAKPKVGKSTIARNLAISVALGKSFLSRAIQKGPVIYLALEEKRSEVKKHFVEMGATGEEEVYIFAAAAPVDALQQVRVVVEEKKPVLIIIDPLFRFTRVKDGNDYNAVTAALEPLLVLARETGAHVLCVHHAGKGEREGGDSILGSTAIFGAVDTALIMKRSERYRTLSSIQRYGEDLPETVLRFDPHSRTVSLGESKESEEEKRIAEAILAYLKSKTEAVTEAELSSEVEGRTTYKRNALRALVASGQVERTGKGGKSDPFRYALPVAKAPGAEAWEDVA